MRVFKLTLLSSSGKELAELLCQRLVRMVLTGSADEDAGTWPMAGGELFLELNEPSATRAPKYLPALTVYMPGQSCVGEECC